MSKFYICPSCGTESKKKYCRLACKLYDERESRPIQMHYTTFEKELKQIRAEMKLQGMPLWADLHAPKQSLKHKMKEIREIQLNFIEVDTELHRRGLERSLLE